MAVMRNSLFTIWPRFKLWCSYMADIGTKTGAPEDPNLGQMIPALFMAFIIVAVILGVMM